MNEFDSDRCKMALKIIDAFLAEERGFRVTIGDLRALITLLGENEILLSRALRDNWNLLQEVRAYTLYRRASAMSSEDRALVTSTLNDMKSLIRNALGEFSETARRKFSA
jgi:hypothetical protein